MRRPDGGRGVGGVGAEGPGAEADAEEADNLARLAHLTQDTVLRALRLRFDKRLIYTYLGDILVAVNPWQKLPIYTEEIQSLYKGAVSKKLPPHIYAMADRGYDALVRNKTPQCFVISGESGAGKTESTKLLVRHIVELCRAGNTTLEDKLLIVNPLLEAFGNAKTGLNDNSSRFGKYLELQMDATGAIRGSTLRHYLLEKSRVTKRNANEHNFHVFYQLYAGLKEEKRLKDFFLAVPSAHSYLQGRGAPTDSNIFGGKYREEWRTSVEGLTVLGFKTDDILSMVAILAAILHVGDVVIADAGHDTVRVMSPLTLLQNIAALLDLDALQLRRSFEVTHVLARGELVQRNFNLAAANENRDALSKFLYSSMFSWIMTEINQSLMADITSDTLVMGLLDIFGFEAFDNNSLEQLCINVANEQLQHFFNRHIFAMEQEEYAREGVDFSRIEFPDNQSSLDLLLKRPLAVLPILDEESHFPQGTDASFVSKCMSLLINHPSKAFQPPRFDADLQFTIAHFAGSVTYNAVGFLVKNRDTLSADIFQVLNASNNELLQKLLAIDKPSTTIGTHKLLKTMCMSFRTSLADLVERLNACAPHFIRCIKPNDLQRKSLWDEALVKRQLQYSGVLETIKIRKLGYSYRLPFEVFVKRFKNLAFKFTDNPPLTQATCLAICQQIRLADYQIGRTQVFMKYYHADELAQRAQAHADAVVLFQRLSKAHLARQRHQVLLADKRRQDEAVSDFLDMAERWGVGQRRKFVICAMRDEVLRQNREWLQQIQLSVARAEAAKRQQEWARKQQLENIANEPKMLRTNFHDGFMVWQQNEFLDLRVGPLPYPWKQKVEQPSGRIYFKHLETKRTTWVDPRSYHWRKHDPLLTEGDELPYGWDLGEFPDGSRFYINHLTNSHHRLHPRVLLERQQAEAENKRRQHQEEATRILNGIKTLREKRARLISQLAGAVDEAERAEINDRVEALDGAIVREQKKLSSTQKAIELVLAHMAKLRNTKLIDVDKAVKRCATRWLEKTRKRRKQRQVEGQGRYRKGGRA